MRTRRLTADDRDLARRLFALMAEVFEEGCERLGDAYLDRLLALDFYRALGGVPSPVTFFTFSDHDK